MGWLAVGWDGGMGVCYILWGSIFGINDRAMRIFSGGVLWFFFSFLPNWLNRWKTDWIRICANYNFSGYAWIQHFIVHKEISRLVNQSILRPKIDKVGGRDRIGRWVKRIF